MSNHYHFVVFIKDYIVLNEIQDFKLLPHEKAIKNFLISYSKSFNKLYGSSGGVFYPNYRRNHIHNEDYLKNAILYTHLNPAKHRIYRNYENYAHSSYQTILQGSSEMVKYNEVIKLFGSKEEFVDAHKQAFGKLDDNNDFFERD